MTRSAAVARAVPDELSEKRGLDQQQVGQRLTDGRDNRTTQPTSRSAWSIVAANVFTRFNALLGALCVLVLVVGPIQNALFGLVVIANSAVGIVAEMRAKRTLDRLHVLTPSTARAVREGGQTRRFVAVDFAALNGKEICALSVRPADAPVYLGDGAEPRLYVRTGNATTPLALDDAVQYVGSRWPGRTTGHLLDALLGRHT
jgi:cation-transporting ATPase E